MPRPVLVFVIALVGVVVSLVGFVAVKIASNAPMWHPGRIEQATVIRHPGRAGPPAGKPAEGMPNIAPQATVSVSSIAASDRSSESGVADGVVDALGWVTDEETAGAWIKLSWDAPATISEIALYDRSDRTDNVLSGTLSFDDGSVLPVPALPPRGPRGKSPSHPRPSGRSPSVSTGRKEGRPAWRRSWSSAAWPADLHSMCSSHRVALRKSRCTMG